MEDRYTSYKISDTKSSFIDDYGVMYSSDKKKLLNADSIVQKYTREVPKVIVETLGANGEWSHVPEEVATEEVVLDHYSICDGTEIVCDNAFSKCEAIKSIFIPDSVIFIGSNAFNSSSLESIVVEPISYYRFLSVMPELRSKIEIKASYGANREDGVKDEFGGLYSKDGSMFIHMFDSKIENYSIKQGTKYICPGAFERSKLKTISLPNSILAIGFMAFSECYSLTSVTIPDSVMVIGAHAFEYCINLTNIEIGHNVISIGDYAFASCVKVANIKLPDGVTNIGRFAFNECNNLLHINIPLGVSCLNYGLFHYCGSLQGLTIPENVIEIKGNPFSGVFCTIINKSDSFSFYKGALYSKDYSLLISYFGDSNEDSFKVPEYVKEIGPEAFKYCKLKNIFVPNSVNIIGPTAFCGCHNIETFSFPSGMKVVESGIMDGCKNLREVKLPYNVSDVKEWAFSCCVNLETVVLPQKKLSVHKKSFYRCDSLSFFKFVDSNGDVLKVSRVNGVA